MRPLSAYPLISRATAQRAGGSARASRVTMGALAAAFLESLNDEQRRRACWPFDDPQRFDWHYVPRPREGLPLGAMGEASRRAVHDLLNHALGEAGYQKATDILRLEGVLGRIEGRPQHRDPDNYSVTVFGRPGKGPWGWRIEGHHLSLNFTAVSERLTAINPAFWGSNPARVPDDQPMAGHRVLGRETDLSFALIRGLDETLRTQAIIAPTSMGDIVTGPGREDALQRPEGLSLGAMPDGLRDLAMELIGTFAHNLSDGLAAVELDRIRQADLAAIRFAWAGALEPGEPNYWRLHGPITVIEYDNTQNDANHIHTVWHDPTRNFGRDLLREHYAGGGHHHR
jgi:hypothetical protein